MKNVSKLILLGLLSFMATGCSIYYPKCTDIPLIREKGELQVEGAILPYDPPRNPVTGHVSVAYGATDHLAVAASGDAFRSYAQAIAGAFFPVGEKFVWEIYGGVGVGKGEHYRDSDPELSSSGKYGLAFVQFDGGWNNLTRFLNLDIAFGLKSGVLHGNYVVGNMRWEPTDSSGFGEYHYYSTYPEETCLLLEPTVELRFGWPSLKFNIKAGVSYPFGSKYNYTNPGIGFGISYRFNLCNKSKRQNSNR